MSYIPSRAYRDNWRSKASEERNLEEDLDTGNFSDSNLFTCRNSVQGKAVIADDKGFVCPRTELLGNGCCNVNSSLTEKHVCGECDEVYNQ